MAFEQIIFVALAVAVGTLVQTSVGFGAGLFAIPIMVWAGVELFEAIGAILVVVLVQTGWGCWRYRADVPWRATWQLLWLRLITMPLGVWLLGTYLQTWDQGRIKQLLGAVLLTVLIVQWALRVRPRPSVHWGWTAAAGGSSGLMAGVVGMGGPPVVLWVMAHDWPSRRSRAFLWATFLQLLPIQLGLMLLQFGEAAAWSFAMGLASLPAALLGGVVGMRIGAALSREWLRRVALGLLAVIALASVAAPWFE